MSEPVSRRDVVKGGAAFASAAVFGRWSSLFPSLQQGEDVVPWTDIPANFNPGTSPTPSVFA